MAVDDVYRLTLTFLIGHQHAQTTCHFMVDESESTNPGLRAEQIGAQFTLAYFADLTQVLAQNVSWVSVIVARINNDRGPSAYHRIPINNGARPSDCDMPESGPVLLFRGRGSGRWINARMFLPGVAKLDVLNAQFIPALYTELVDLADALAVEHLVFDGHNADLVIWSEKDLAFVPVISSGVSPGIGVQRGRLRPIF